MRPARRFAAVIAALMLLPVTVLAQHAADHGIGGFWMVNFGPMPPLREPSETEAAMIAALRDDAVLLADSGLVEFELGQYGGLDIHDSLVEAAEDFDPLAQASISTTCTAPGLTYSMQGPFPIEIFEGRDIIVMKMEYFDLVRIILMNETEHPDDWPTSMTGHSIGRWDGDTLVVDTVGFAPGILARGVPHSDRLHVVERFSLDSATSELTREFVAEDPLYFVDSYVGEDRVLPADAEFAVDECKELAFEYVTPKGELRGRAPGSSGTPP